MAREVGDLWPQVSGSAALGAEMTNGGFTGAVRPFAGVFMNSGVFHNPGTGTSGVIRFQLSQERVLTVGEEVFGFSTDGGKTFHLQLGDNAVGYGGQGADIVAPFGPMRIIGSGGMGTLSLGPDASNQMLANDGPLVLQAFGDGVGGRGGIFVNAKQNTNLSPFNGSGQLEFRFGPHQGWAVKLTHSNTGGPANDGFWPLPHSGQVAAMIALAGGTAASMQASYNGGDEILLTQAGGRTNGILLKQPAAARYMKPSDLINQDPGYGIAVSGITPTPQNPSSYYISYLGMNALAFQGSGEFGNNGSHLWLGIDPSTSVATIASSGLITISSSGLNGSYNGGVLHYVTGGSHKTFADSLVELKSIFSSLNLFAGDGGMTLTTADGQGGSSADILLAANTDVHLQAFSSSGEIVYRFGPHQSWYIKTSHANTGGPFNDGFWPIAHSGNVAQMIAQGGGSGPTSLQTAYQNGRSIITRTNEGGPVRVSGLTAAALRLETNEGGFAHLELSGVLKTPTGFTEQGSILLMRHSLNLDSTRITNINSQDDISSISAGIPTLWLHCGGSGVVPFRTASGVAQFFNVAASAAINEIGLALNLSETSQSHPDKFFRPITSSGIQVLVPGLYSVKYAASMEKTAGELEQNVKAEMRLYDQWGNTWRILGGVSYVTLRDLSSPLGTANGQCVFDINAGEVINLFASSTSIPIPPNSVRFAQRTANLVVEYLGPQRSITGLRQKVT